MEFSEENCRFNPQESCTILNVQKNLQQVPYDTLLLLKFHLNCESVLWLFSYVHPMSLHQFQ